MHVAILLEGSGSAGKYVSKLKHKIIHDASIFDAGGESGGFIRAVGVNGKGSAGPSTCGFKDTETLSHSESRSVNMIIGLRRRHDGETTRYIK